MDKSIYNDVIDGMTFSYSRLSCYDTCPYKWYLKYICESHSEDLFYASYGSFIHKLIENFYKGLIKQEDLVQLFLSGFSANVKGDRPSEKIINSYIQKGIDYFSSFKPFPYKTIAVEKKVDCTINGRNFIGYIDYLGELDGEYYIVDNKSRDLKPRSKRKNKTQKDIELDTMLKQLYLYAEAVYQEYGKYPKMLCFNCFKSNVFIEEPFNYQDLENAKVWFSKTIDDLKNTKDFYPDIDYFKCRYICDVHSDCVYYNS